MSNNVDPISGVPYSSHSDLDISHAFAVGYKDGGNVARCAERERCAKIAEEQTHCGRSGCERPDCTAAREIAAKIRSGE